MCGCEGHRQVAGDDAIDITDNIWLSRGVDDARPPEAGSGKRLLKALRLVGRRWSCAGSPLLSEVGPDKPFDVVMRDRWGVRQLPRGRAGRVVDDKRDCPTRFQRVVD